eukprot:403376842
MPTALKNCQNLDNHIKGALKDLLDQQQDIKPSKPNEISQTQIKNHQLSFDTLNLRLQIINFLFVKIQLSLRFKKYQFSLELLTQLDTFQKDTFQLLKDCQNTAEISLIDQQNIFHTLTLVDRFYIKQSQIQKIIEENQIKVELLKIEAKALISEETSEVKELEYQLMQIEYQIQTREVQEYNNNQKQLEDAQTLNYLDNNQEVEDENQPLTTNKAKSQWMLEQQKSHQELVYLNQRVRGVIDKKNNQMDELSNMQILKQVGVLIASSYAAYRTYKWIMGRK